MVPSPESVPTAIEDRLAGLQPAALKLYDLLIGLASTSSSGLCWPSLDYLRGAVRVCKASKPAASRTISNALVELQRRRLLVRLSFPISPRGGPRSFFLIAVTAWSPRYGLVPQTGPLALLLAGDDQNAMQRIRQAVESGALGEPPYVAVGSGRRRVPVIALRPPPTPFKAKGELAAARQDMGKACAGLIAELVVPRPPVCTFPNGPGGVAEADFAGLISGRYTSEDSFDSWGWHLESVLDDADGRRSAAIEDEGHSQRSARSTGGPTPAPPRPPASGPAPATRVPPRPLGQRVERKEVRGGLRQKFAASQGSAYSSDRTKGGEGHDRSYPGARSASVDRARGKAG